MWECANGSTIKSACVYTKRWASILAHALAYDSILLLECVDREYGRCGYFLNETESHSTELNCADYGDLLRQVTFMALGELIQRSSSWSSLVLKPHHNHEQPRILHDDTEADRLLLRCLRECKSNGFILEVSRINRVVMWRNLTNNIKLWDVVY